MSQAIQDYKFVLQANAERNVRITGFSSLTILDAASPVSLKLDNGSYVSNLLAGDGFDDIQFSDVTLLSAVAQTIRVRVSQGKQRTGQSVNVITTATVESANSNPAVGDVAIPANTKVQVIGANADRQAVLIRSDEDNVAAVRIGDDATVTASAGFKLLPDDSISLPTEGAVYAHNTSLTDDAVLSVIELERI